MCTKSIANEVEASFGQRSLYRSANEQSKNDKTPLLVVPSKNENLPGVSLKAEAPQRVSRLLFHCLNKCENVTYMPLA